MVFLCEGDPLLYGSFAHLLPRLGNRFECEVIPGITSISAAAAAAQQPLGLYDEPIALVPATAHPKKIAGILQQCDRVVVMKVGRHLDKVREALRVAQMSEGAVLVENATQVGQRVRPLAYVTEPDLERWAEHRQFPIIPCTLCGSQDNLQRVQIKQMLRDWDRRFPGRIDNMHRAFANVVPSHLLDRQLHPFATLQPTGQANPGGDRAFEAGGAPDPLGLFVLEPGPKRFHDLRAEV